MTLKVALQPIHLACPRNPLDSMLQLLECMLPGESLGVLMATAAAGVCKHLCRPDALAYIHLIDTSPPWLNEALLAVQAV